ncbi:NAD(P)H-dependent flavin oxidoreductase [Nocardia asteroides]|uniref:NAD(P)H-dependent flavin oxidoreductase n=1 Tax=Nocardia asteroides TaxID=1824 RepID=UPI001E6186C8|nr:nitronate monooxygenase [Nocardia asteroides]UGT62346.1 nitronate monooxygenase [Nocardia asteroides]
MRTTAWARELGLRIPVVNAPMGGVAGGRLAAAVRAAGGLGMIGMGSAGSAAALRTELALAGDGVGIGVVDWVLRAEPELLEQALAARPWLLSVSFGTDLSWVAAARAHGIRTATQVYSADEAKRAHDAGIDVLVARGAAGGGHGTAAPELRPLLDEVLAAVPIPVLAAGGIATAADLAAVLAAGASGAWIGTRFAACAESLLPEPGRNALIAATADDTVLTSAYDIAAGLPWPARFPSRVLRDPATDRWAGHEDDLRGDPVARAELRSRAADPATAPVDAGRGVGAITRVETAAEILESLGAAAE